MQYRIENVGGDIVVNGNTEISPYTLVTDSQNMIITTSGTDLLITKEV